MNIPNTLTIARIIASVFLLILLATPIPFGKSLALGLFIMAALTDYLDGYLARNVYGVSSFGKLMDPLADKILTCVALVSFVEIRLPFYPGEPLLPAWIVVIVIAREFTVTGLRLLGAGKGTLISAGRWGKHKTVWQIVAISVILLGLAIRDDLLHRAGTPLLTNYDLVFHWIALGLGYAVAAITVVSGYLYVVENFGLISRSFQDDRS